LADLAPPRLNPATNSSAIERNVLDHLNQLIRIAFEQEIL
jgi:hypothetical protein